MVRWLAGLALVVVFAGCSEDPRTEIVVSVGSNLSVPGQLDQIHIGVVGPDMELREATATLGDGQPPLPRTLGLLHEEGPLGPLSIRVVGRMGGVDVVERRARTSFIEGRTLLLEMDLLASCLGTMCAASTTCTAGGCQPVDVDPETLPEWEGGEPGIDAGMVEQDAGVDAGPAPDAGPEPDAGGCVPSDEMCNGEDDDCDDAIDEGFDLESDPNNCGMCGMRCTPPDRDCCAGSCGRC